MLHILRQLPQEIKMVITACNLDDSIVKRFYIVLYRCTARARAHTHAHTCVRTHTHTHAHTRARAHTHTHTHTHKFNGPFSGTTQVSQYQKGKTNVNFNEARDSEWQWHQLGHMQVCTLLQTDNHTSTPPLCFYRPDALPATQPTASKH